MSNNIILVRSPRIIQVSGVLGDSTSLELFMYNEGQPVPTLPTKTLSKHIPTTEIGENVYDISPYIRRFIKHISYSEPSAPVAGNSSEYCYCKVKAYKNGVLQTSGGAYTYEFICFDGFGYHVEGYNPSSSLSLMTEGTYYTEEDNGYGGLYVVNPDTSLNDMVVRYTHPSGVPQISILLTNNVNKMPSVHPTLVADGCTTEVIQATNVIATYKFTPICEHKYDPVKCDFVNKFGAWQRLTFFKASRETFEVSSKEYNLKPSNVDYNVQEGVKNAFNVNSKESIKCNTGFVLEEQNEVLRQLMLSETILIDGKPATLKTKSLNLQTNLNDKNINYELEFNYSNPVLNYNI